MMNEIAEKGISMEDKYFIAINIISGIFIGTSVAIISNKISYKTFENKQAIDRVMSSFEYYDVLPILQTIKENGFASETKNKNLNKAVLSLKNKNIDINHFFFKEHTYFYQILYKEIFTRLENLSKVALEGESIDENKKQAGWLISHYTMLIKWNRKMYKSYLQELYDASNQVSRIKKIKAFIQLRIAPYFWI